MKNKNYNHSQQTRPLTISQDHINQELPTFALEIISFQRTCPPPSHLTIYIKSFLRMMVILHTFIGYLLLSNDVLSEGVKQIVTFLKAETSLYRAVQIFAYFFNLLLLGVVITDKTRQKNKVKVSIETYMVTNYFLLGALNLFITFFLAYINLPENICAMLLAIGIAVIENVFFQNYCLKNQLNYMSSQFYSLAFKCVIIFNLTANCLFVYLGSFTLFICSSILFGLIAIVWYLKGGYKLHYHKNPKKIKLFLCSLWGSLSVEFFILKFKGRQSFDFVQWVIVCCLILVYLVIYCEQKRLRLRQLYEKQHLKEYEFFLMLLLQEANQIEIQNTIVGLLSQHETHLCSNVYCKVSEYCKNADNNFSSLIKDKHELFVSYIKCIYETELSKNKSRQNMIDYCQFIISQYGNFSTHCFYFEELALNQSTLSIFQKIKVNKLRLILQDQSQAFNKLLFGGRVQFLDILDSGNHFDFIIQKITEYCTQAETIWQSALLKLINVSQWKEAVQRNFQLLPKIDQKWKYLSKYFYVQKQWKFIYLNYAYYLKNQQVKNRQFEPLELGSSKLIEFGLDSKLKSIKDAIFFDTNTAVLEAELKDRRLTFKKINKNFEKLTHYSKEEIINAPLSTIQPYEIRENHDERICRVIQRGNTLKEQGYHVLGAYFVTKQGNKVDASIMFKLYITSSSQDCLIHFVAMIVVPQSKSKASGPLLNSQDLTEKLQMDLQIPLQTNIFSKEEQLQATQDNVQFIKIVGATRLIIIFFFACILIAFFLINSQMSKGQYQIVQQEYMINAYRYPIAIAVNYIKQFLNLTDPAIVKAKIQHFTILLMQLANDPLMITMLADQKINPPATYPPLITNQINKGLQYDQIDIFYVIVSSMMTLSSSKTINRTGNDYIRLDSYLYQYNRMINNTKMQLHNQFITLMDQCHNYQVSMLVAISCAFVITTIFLCYRVYVYYNKRAELLRIILQFDQSQISRIIHYWHRVYCTFKLFGTSGQPQTQFKRSSLGLSQMGESSLLNEYVQQKKQVKISLNQRPKTITVSEQESAQFFNLIVFLLVLLGIIFIINIGVPIFNLTQFTAIKSFEAAGFDIFRFLCFTGELSYAMSRTYYYNLFPNQTSLIPEQFSQSLVTLDIMSNYQYIEAANSDNTFFTDRKNYLFGNPCTYNPQVLIINNSTLQSCLTLANGSLNAGIPAFLRNVKPTITNFLLGKIKLTQAQVSSLSSSLANSIFYYYDMMYAWLDDLQQMIISFSNESLILIIVSFLVSVLLYIITLQYWLIFKLQKDYNLLKNIYNCYVPESILIKQKVIRQKFCQTGIIH